ncbi:MAG TPA: hypothetical protein VFN89_10645 [Solirubrobacterales bacterium]|nr:hypothetical protein [Solirubrobacterales bacterium]
MPRPIHSALVLALAGAAALGLVACGGEDAKLLPGETAREITANLDTVKQLAGEQDCIGAESAVQQVGEEIEALQGVDPKLKRALEEGAERLEEVIAECEESSSEAIAPEETPSEFEEEETEKAPEQKEAKEKKAKPGDEEQAPEAQTLPPQAKGEGKGLEKGNGPPPPEEPIEETPGGSPSGGVGPSAPASEGEE